MSGRTTCSCSSIRGGLVKSTLSDICTVAGLLAVAVGLGMLAPWLGVTVGGLLLIGLGYLVEARR